MCYNPNGSFNSSPMWDVNIAGSGLTPYATMLAPRGLIIQREYVCFFLKIFSWFERQTERQTQLPSSDWFSKCHMGARNPGSPTWILQTQDIKSSLLPERAHMDRMLEPGIKPGLEPSASTWNPSTPKAAWSLHPLLLSFSLFCFALVVFRVYIMNQKLNWGLAWPSN